MSKEREIDGIRIVLNREQYETYKGTLQDQISELQNRIDKVIEYIETLEKREAYKIVDNENGVPSLVVDNEEYLVLCKYNKLLNILKGDNK